MICVQHLPKITAPLPFWKMHNNFGKQQSMCSINLKRTFFSLKKKMLCTWGSTRGDNYKYLNGKVAYHWKCFPHKNDFDSIFIDQPKAFLTRVYTNQID